MIEMKNRRESFDHCCLGDFVWTKKKIISEHLRASHWISVLPSYIVSILIMNFICTLFILYAYPRFPHIFTIS